MNRGHKHGKTHIFHTYLRTASLLGQNKPTFGLISVSVLSHLSTRAGTKHSKPKPYRVRARIPPILVLQGLVYDRISPFPADEGESLEHR